MIHGKILGIGLASLFAVEIGADLLNMPSWFKETAAAAAAIGSTILFLKYITYRDKTQGERENARDASQAQRDKLFAETLTGLADDFREDRERDRQERREGWTFLTEAVSAMRHESNKKNGTS